MNRNSRSARERSMAESLTIFRCRSFKNGGRLRRDVGRIRDHVERSGRNARDPISNSSALRGYRPFHLDGSATNPHPFNASRPPSLRRKQERSSFLRASSTIHLVSHRLFLSFVREFIKKKKTFERKFSSYKYLYNEYM